MSCWSNFCFVNLLLICWYKFCSIDSVSNLLIQLMICSSNFWHVDPTFDPCIQFRSYWSNFSYVDPTFHLLIHFLISQSSPLTKSEFKLNSTWAWHNFSHSLFWVFFYYCSAWLRLNLNTEIGLHTTTTPTNFLKGYRAVALPL